MYINKSDLEFLISLENFIGERFGHPEDPNVDYVIRLINLNERLLEQREKTNKYVREHYREKRKENPHYGRKWNGKLWC